MNHRLKINGNILEITLPENIHIDKVIVNREIFSQRQRVCESCKYHGLEGHEEPCVSCEVGNSNYVAVEERTEERTETHACDCISRQDAINAFEPDHPVDWYTTMIVDVLENLPSAELERDVPIKPNETTDHSWGIPQRQAVCPNCDYYLGKVSFIGDGTKNMVTYCEHCGQAIDWSEWEEGEQDE